MRFTLQPAAAAVSAQVSIHTVGHLSSWVLGINRPENRHKVTRHLQYECFQLLELKGLSES